MTKKTEIDELKLLAKRYAHATRSNHREAFDAIASELGDLPPDGPSFITRVCGSGFHIPRFRFGQARRARSPQIAQASGALLRAFDCRAMSAV